MPRLARTVFPDVPHHITQRGNRRENVFFQDEDREYYLSLLKEYSEKHSVDVLAYCLMTNHIHLVLLPSDEKGLQNLLKPLHMRYTQRVNRNNGWKGRLWQGRYFSSALDEAYTWAAIRYTELNPVRAKMVRRAEDYKWSSAAGHCKLKDDKIISKDSTWIKRFESAGNWSEWLNEGVNDKRIETIRRNIEKGLPCGSDRFIKKLERITDSVLHYRPQGRPKKKKG